MDDNTITRIEEKYMISQAEMSMLLQKIEQPHLKKDKFYKEEVLSVYFDTEDYQIANRSIDRPDFRFKLRVRAYDCPDKNSPVFFEIKSKLAQGKLHLGNKRRLVLFLGDFYKYLKSKNPEKPSNKPQKSLEFYAKRYATAYKKKNPKAVIPAEDFAQIQFARELEYFMGFYNPTPKVLISADRLAFCAKEDTNFRLTFDQNLRYRTQHLRLEKGSSGTAFFGLGGLERFDSAGNPCDIIMEVKTMNAMPLWFVRELSRLNIYPVRFSKYGKIYQYLYENHLLPLPKSRPKSSTKSKKTTA